jgi:hypothetical protein
VDCACDVLGDAEKRSIVIVPLATYDTPHSFDSEERPILAAALKPDRENCEQFAALGVSS